MDPIEELVTRGVANIIPGRKEFEERLRSGEKLNIYLGIDPTATHIHLGHAFPLRKLQKFADLGHNVTFLIGSFTALIGDTSDKDTERPVLTAEQIEENFQTYKQQAEKVLDFSKITVKYNGDWLQKLTFEEIVKLCQHFSVGDFVGRELIRKRLEDNKRVGLHEVLYPVMQGYDSYYLDTDLQIGGTDQTFNMQAGRMLQKDLRHKNSFIMTNVFLEGTDGRKMSKSWGNAIWLDDEANDMYTKVMRINDELIEPYFTLATDLSVTEIADHMQTLKEQENYVEIKKILAHTIVTELHSKEKADQAAENFTRTIQNKELPENIDEIQVNSDQLLDEDFLVSQGFAASKSEAKRLFEQGGVELEGEKITGGNERPIIENNAILKIGKRRIVKVVTT